MTKNAFIFSDEKTAENFIKKAGACLGVLQRNEPRGIMFGYDYVGKWKNLSDTERKQCHAVYKREYYGGPVVVTLSKHCPSELVNFFSRYYRAVSPETA